MKTISIALDSHLQDETISTAVCWKVTWLNNTVFTFTSCDRDLPVDSLVYKASTGFTRSAIQTSAALNVDNLDLEGIFDSTAVTEADLRAGWWDYAQVEIFTVNYKDISQGKLKQRRGHLGNVTAGRSRFMAELRGLTQNLQQEIGELYGAACSADVGDARCGVNLAAFTVTGAITGVVSQVLIADSSRTEATGWFDHGKITFTSGLNINLSMEVKSYSQAGGNILLHLPMPYAVAISDAYSMHAGCDKSRPTCQSKYGNVVNYRGFPDVPGTDLMITGGI